VPQKTYKVGTVAAAEAVTRFASLWDSKKDETLITSPSVRGQVENALVDAAYALGDESSAGTGLVDFDISFTSGANTDYIADQQVLRDWLKQIVRFKKLTLKKQTELLTEIMQWAALAHGTSSLVVKHGRFHRVYKPHFSSVRALIGEVLTHLPQLQPRAEATLTQGDVLQCSVCKTFYVISRSDDTGVCSPRCRTARSRSK
jgi:hypothetical protein